MHAVFVLAILFLTTAKRSARIVAVLGVNGSWQSSSLSSRRPFRVSKWSVASSSTTKNNDVALMDLDVFQFLEELKQSRSRKNIPLRRTSNDDIMGQQGNKEDSSNRELPSKTGLQMVRLVGNRIRTALLLGILKLIVLLHMEVWVVRYLPDRVLVEVARLCLARDARPHVLRLMATELDRRVQNYQFGDITKSIVCRYTGQSTYQFGDITRTILAEAQKQNPQVAERIQQQLDIFLQSCSSISS